MSQQEVFIKTKWGKLTASDAVMVLLLPKKIVLLPVPLVAGHAHMVSKMCFSWLVRLFILIQRRFLIVKEYRK